MWKKRIILTLWVLLGSATIVLLVSAMHKKEIKTVSDIKVEIEGAEQHVFVDEKDIIDFLNKMGVKKGTELFRIDTRHLEDGLKMNGWIRDADLFFDNNSILHVDIQEREPMARIFTISGNSFYIDSSGKRLPLSDNLSARVPVFTSYPSDNKKLSAPDSVVLAEIKYIAQHIQRDSFWLQQVAQVDLTPQHTYEIVPVLGNQVITLGDTSNLADKFNRLYSFYRQVWAKAGFEKYERIDVQYDGQVVASRRGAAKPYLDSAKAMQQLSSSLRQMNTMMRDTSVGMDAKLLNVVKDTSVKKVLPAKIMNRPQVKPKPVLKAKAPVVKKKTVKKTVNNSKSRKPKAVLQRHY
ncbi:cell division protein FtsQ/DivIB [Foetidibacter luteolus]|uniref:cell division protein FtsQ/DivIB n=1 Tax=Foetidibacter luteolus TaxID=2608880 RepID=UPI00129BF1F2|nr:cell division protein FtsQ/DivIB [Foetidibacter luteolus]